MHALYCSHLGVVSLKSVKENGDSRWKMVNSKESVKLHSYRYGKHCNSCTCQQKENELERKQNCEDILSTIPDDFGIHGYES